MSYTEVTTIDAPKNCTLEGLFNICHKQPDIVNEIGGDLLDVQTMRNVQPDTRYVGRGDGDSVVIQGTYKKLVDAAK